jgi:BioD-like phosphotransacetylase family protein
MINGIEKRLFVAATSQNDGKTTCTLGFLDAYREKAKSVGFIKPVGQRYVLVDGQTIDEDSVLVQRVCALRCPLKDMSPVAIERNFTRQFLDDPDGVAPGLVRSIRDSFAMAAKDNDMVVIEGTGHAGVGSVFDMSNARVARMLNAKVIIVTLGGIGRPVDEVALNHNLFESEHVEVVGVIANKIQPEKLDQTREYLTKAFARRGLALLGVLPYSRELTWPTVAQVAKAIRATVVNGHQCLSNKIAEIVVGAMTAHNALKFIKDKALLIVPGDRDDVVLAAAASDLLRHDIDLSGIILTGGMHLAPQTRELIMRTHIPILTVEMPTYEATALIHDITVKILESDEEKIALATSMVRQYVDLDRLWDLLS